MMKSLKAAAVVAGSLIAASVGGPAFAVDVANAGFSGGLNTKVPIDLPLHEESDVAQTTHRESLIHSAATALNDTRPMRGTTKDATAALRDVKPLHGGLTL
ncbi:hypothetical protein [Streptomyces sp. NPDC001315]|uniref:hypothetical protein n=1 Tax=Streptomyces sp. NPDC001315 TaxID=3364562 RepID=UPI0036C6E827